MINHDRLDELSVIFDEETPDEDSRGQTVHMRLPVRDVRDLVSLIPALRAAIALRNAVLRAIITKPAVVEAVKRFDGERGVT